MKKQSYNTSKFCCKNNKSIITVKKVEHSFEATCNDCGNKIEGKKEVTKFLLS